MTSMLLINVRVFDNSTVILPLLASKRHASFIFDTTYFLNGRSILFKSFTISHYDIRLNHKRKPVTFIFNVKRYMPL